VEAVEVVVAVTTEAVTLATTAASREEEAAEVATTVEAVVEVAADPCVETTVWAEAVEADRVPTQVVNFQIIHNILISNNYLIFLKVEVVAEAVVATVVVEAAAAEVVVADSKFPIKMVSLCNYLVRVFYLTTF